MTSTMDLPTQRDTDDPTPTPDIELTASELDGAATDRAVDDDTSSTDLGDTPLDELSDEQHAALHARWDAEVDTVIWVDPDEVLIAENVRTDNAEADEETTANFKTHKDGAPRSHMATAAIAGRVFPAGTASFPLPARRTHPQPPRRRSRATTLRCRSDLSTVAERSPRRPDSGHTRTISGRCDGHTRAVVAAAATRTSNPTQGTG
ncbi:hypothetical protein QRX60_27605 [Amycolatopsis mongoliensis]|uniref:Uncharacterized protein n=1 Tax=Amycolatopsis mongoliensis TaxID=715475 RepID=A0A9Y2JFV6_9PSEU|nr:hypothetical protein [Amycolatopsis sp. 4-36]WIX97850.1 hypothetical protein QRX60_27605 [Amycolatopsis sp. 4-36]